MCIERRMRRRKVALRICECTYPSQLVELRAQSANMVRRMLRVVRVHEVLVILALRALRHFGFRGVWAHVCCAVL